MEKKKFKEKFKEYWQVPRYKALIKMGFYFIFLIIVGIIITINGKQSAPPKEEEKPIEEKSLVELQSALLENNYEFTYQITSNNEITRYNGKRFKDKELGYKETKDIYLRYYKENNISYKLVLGQKQPINNLYEIDSNFLEASYIFDLIKLEKTVKDYQENLRVNNYDFMIEENPIKVSIFYNATEINEIDITYFGNDYKLSYKNIGNILEEDVVNFNE